MIKGFFSFMVPAASAFVVTMVDVFIIAVSIAGVVGFAQQPPDVWKVTLLAPVESVGMVGEQLQYYSLAMRQGPEVERFVIMGDESHPVIRFLAARRGSMVTLTVTGGTPE